MDETVTVTMSSDQIKDAIRVEPNLASGRWIFHAGNVSPPSRSMKKENCSFCAVGAALCSAAVPLDRIYDVACSLTRNTCTSAGFCNDEEAAAAVKACPFAALSRAYESAWGSAAQAGLYSDELVEKAREAALDFVGKYFPPEITFKYNGTAVWV